MFSAGEGSAEDVAIETPDDRTLKVTLENPTPFFLGLTALTPYLPAFLDRLGLTLEEWLPQEGLRRTLAP